MRIGGLALACAMLLATVGTAKAQQVNDKLYVPSSNQALPFDDKTLFSGPSAATSAPLKETPWCGGVEVGLVGSDGNSNVFKARLGANTKRSTEDNYFMADLAYGYATQNGKISENKALFNTRDEILFANSPWTIFGSGQVEYDQFRAFDFRVASHTGVGNLLLKTDTTCIRGRVGAGFSREIGGPQDRWVPEGLVGGDFEHRLTERQRVLATVDWYPDLGAFGQYRLRSRAGYEILIDPSMGLTLRLGIQDRYDSNPGPAKRNDLDYFMTLLFKF